MGTEAVTPTDLLMSAEQIDGMQSWMLACLKVDGLEHINIDRQEIVRRFCAQAKSALSLTAQLAASQELARTRGRILDEYEDRATAAESKLAEVWGDALEEAAKVCDTLFDSGVGSFADGAWVCAERIRALSQSSAVGGCGVNHLTDDCDCFQKIVAFNARRDKALAELDMEWAREQMLTASSDEVRLISMHKARYEAVNIEPALRLESKAWLQERGYGRLYGLPFTEELPT